MKKYSIFCFLLTGIFFIIQVSVLGYTVYFLGKNGYKASEIASLMAVAGIVAAIIQPLLGNIADKNKKIDFKNILSVTGLIVIILFLFLFHFDKNKIAAGVLFATIFIFTNSMSPFVNSSCFYYKDRGINVDYGIARGFGSFSFAIASYVLGNFTEKYGTKVISFNGIVASILFLILVLIMPRIKDTKETAVRNEKKISITDNHINLISKYPAFFLIMIATVLAMCFQNSDCGYLIDIIEELGGDSYNLGIANAIAAIVEIPTMFLITKVMKKIKVSKLVMVAAFFYVVRGFVFMIPSMTAIYTAQLMQMFSFAILIPSTVYLSDEMMHEEDKNKGQTFVGMAITLGLILGTFVGGQFVSIGGTSLLKVGCIVIAGLSFAFALGGNIVYAKLNK